MDPEILKKMFDLPSDIILGINNTGNIVLANKEAEKMFKFKREELINKKIDDFILYDNSNSNNEFIIKSHDKKIIPVEVRFSSVILESEEIVIAVIRDTSIQKDIEKELRKLSVALEQSPIEVIITDKEGNIEYVNKYFSVVTDYSSNEVIGKNIKIFQPNNNSIESYQELWSTILSGKIWRGDIQSVKKDGELYWESASVSPIFDDFRNIRNLVIIKRDINDRKAFEVGLLTARNDAEKAQKIAEDSSTAKSDFLSNMSHEIRTPMNAILGMTHLVMKTDLDNKQYNYIKKIDSAAKSLLGIINDILDFSKIESGKLDIELIDFELNDVLENLFNIISEKVSQKELELIIDMSFDTPTSLVGDPFRLGQILLNLVNNAIKFTDNGEVIIEINTLKSDQKKSLIKFSVKDTGIGLNEKQQSKLFQSFQQADISTTRKYGGSGLGLTICKKLVEMMDGEIGLSSEIGKGSVFYFTINFEHSKKLQKKLLEPPKSLKNLNILIIDDNKTVRKVVNRYIKDFNYLVDTVETGMEGIELISKKINENSKNYDLILIDWKMPILDGIETFKKIKNMFFKDFQPKIVLTSGSQLENALELSIQHGFDGFIPKPMSQSQIFDSIMDIFEQGLPKISHRNKKKYLKPKEFDKIRGAEILLVDDNDINRQVATELLEVEGFYVTNAENGEKALELLDNYNKFDLILMDLQMPVMDGYSATKIIRKNEKLKTLPIVAMTADAMNGVRDEVVKIGMNDYITKPINTEEFFITIFKWIKKGKRKLPAKYIESLKTTKNTNSIIDLPGFDTEHALERIGGKLSSYKKTLKKFIDIEKDSIIRLKLALKEEDKNEAVLIAHTLKGVAGNIGAVSLQFIVTELESKLKNSNRIPIETIDRVEKILFDTIGIIKTALYKDLSEEKNINNEVNIPLAKKLLNELSDQIMTYDASASRTIEEVIKHIKGTKLEKSSLELEKYLELYDFEKSGELLKEVFKILKFYK